METDSWRSGAPHFKSVLSAGSLSPKIKIRWSLRYNYTLTPSISLTPVALLLLLSGPQLINTLVSFVTSRLQAINFHLVLNQGYQPSDAYGPFPFGPQPRISTIRCLRLFPCGPQPRISTIRCLQPFPFRKPLNGHGQLPSPYFLDSWQVMGAPNPHNTP